MHKQSGNYKKAAEEFTQSLITGKFYDQSIRNSCLENLYDIFTKMEEGDENYLKNKKIVSGWEGPCPPTLEKLCKEINKKCGKDIIFILDYSGSMEFGKRKKYALNAFLDIFEDYLDLSDRIAFIRFNQNVNIVFELNEKGINYKYLKQHIEATYDIIA